MACSIPDCDRPVLRREWCGSHYKRWLRHGDPLAGGRQMRPPGLTEAEAFAWFMPGEPPASGCWDWTASTNQGGYGQFSMFIGGKSIPILAHVVSYRIYRGPTEEFVLHSCDRPICVQPAHLSLGSLAENNRQMRERDRHARGERVPNSKLTTADVLWIRAQTGMTHREMAERLGVNRATVTEILLGRKWKHL